MKNLICALFGHKWEETRVEPIKDYESVICYHMDCKRCDRQLIYVGTEKGYKKWKCEAIDGE